MYFGECAVANQIDIILYENDNMLSIVDDIFHEEVVVTEADIKEIGRSIWNSFLRVFRTIKTAFENLLLNVNYFKNAEIDEQFNKDLLYVLKTIDLKAMNSYQESLAKIFRIMHRFGQDVTQDFHSILVGELTGGVSDFEFEITKNVTDIKESIESGKSSEEYKRIQANEYKNEKLSKIPLSNIIPDMKESRSKLTKFINEIQKQSEFTLKIPDDNTEVKSLSYKMIIFLGKAADYFKFRISLLQHYFKAAKASLGAIKNNINEKMKGENKSKENYKSMFTQAKQKEVTVKDVAALKESMQNLKEYNSNLEFAKYKEEYKKFAGMLGLNANDGIIIHKLDESTGKALVVGLPNKYEKINVGTRKLYHHSPAEAGSDVDQKIQSEGLKPNALGNKSGLTGLTLYYPEPRVYLHLSVPRTAGNNKVGNDASLFGVPVKTLGENFKGCVYEIEGHYDVYRDPEYKGTAAFIMSDKYVKCKKVDMDKWYKDHSV